MKMRSTCLVGTRLMVQRVIRLPYAIDRPFVAKCKELRVSIASVIEWLIAKWVEGSLVIPLEELRRSQTYHDNGDDEA